MNGIDFCRRRNQRIEGWSNTKFEKGRLRLDILVTYEKKLKKLIVLKIDRRVVFSKVLLWIKSIKIRFNLFFNLHKRLFPRNSLKSSSGFQASNTVFLVS